MKLCLYKLTKSDACIRPLFANSVTYNEALIHTPLASYVHDERLSYVAT